MELSREAVIPFRIFNKSSAILEQAWKQADQFGKNYFIHIDASAIKRYDDVILIRQLEEKNL